MHAWQHEQDVSAADSDAGEEEERRKKKKKRKKRSPEEEDELTAEAEADVYAEDKGKKRKGGTHSQKYSL